MINENGYYCIARAAADPTRSKAQARNHGITFKVRRRPRRQNLSQIPSLHRRLYVLLAGGP